MNWEEKEKEKRKFAIRAYRWHEIGEHKTLWFLFALSILFSIICPILNNIYYPDAIFPKLNALICGLGNISYGYLSGFLVYIFGSFLPSTKDAVEINDRIYFHLYHISEILYYLDKEILPENKSYCDSDLFDKDEEENSYKYERFFLDYLEKNSSEPKDTYSEKYDTNRYINVNVNNYQFLLHRIDWLIKEIDKLFMAYKRDLKSNEIDDLYRIVNAKSMLMNSRSNSSGYLFDRSLLTHFITIFFHFTHVKFAEICKEHGKYSYSGYIIQYLNIDADYEVKQK